MTEVTRKSESPLAVDLTKGEVQNSNCLNCGEPLSGPFCSECGQRAIPAYPTVEELASDAFHEVSGWDGRFVRTFKLLLRRPGELTREFLIGHRARYISPIRLYLVTSVVYFLAAAAAPDNERNDTTVELGQGVRVGVFTPRDSAGDSTATGQDTAVSADTVLTPEQERAEALKSIEESPAWVRPVVRRAFEDPAGFRRSILTAMPRGLFALLPLFAGILALFYRGRHFPEHLYFAFHLHAFLFLIFTVSAVVKMSRVSPLIFVAQLAILTATVVYSTKALRRVYGGSLSLTLAKEAAIGTLYMIASVPMWFALVFWAALR